MPISIWTIQDYLRFTSLIPRSISSTEVSGRDRWLTCKTDHNRFRSSSTPLRILLTFSYVARKWPASSTGSLLVGIPFTVTIPLLRLYLRVASEYLSERRARRSGSISYAVLPEVSYETHAAKVMGGSIRAGNSAKLIQRATVSCLMGFEF